MFEKSTWIRLPRHVAVGHGVLDDVVPAVADLRLGDRALVVTSPTPRDVAGGRVVDSFEAADYETETVVIERAALNPEVDIDKMERLLQMQERVLDRQALMAYSASMAAMQTELPKVVGRMGGNGWKDGSP